MSGHLKEGDYVRHYEIIELLDSGGMAHVYLAFDNKLKRQVAIKTIKADKVEKETIKRFISEARALAQLNHTNITTVYDIEKINGHYYLIIEYLNGVNLKHYLDNGDMSLIEMLKMFKELAAGFSYIHKKGILHRDIKPSNIIITYDHMYKIIDFGISKWDNDPGSYQTKTNFFVGSLRYLAPEVFFNAKGDILSDVYSFGMTILYALLNRPYISGNSTEDIINKIAEDTATLPDILEQNLPEELKEFLFYMIEKDPNERCQSMDEVVKLLDEMIPQIPDSLLSRNLSDIRENPLDMENTLISQKTVVIPHSRTAHKLPRVSRKEMMASKKSEIKEAARMDKTIKMHTESSQAVVSKNTQKNNFDLLSLPFVAKNPRLHQTIQKVSTLWNFELDLKNFTMAAFGIFVLSGLYVYFGGNKKQATVYDSYNHQVDFHLPNEQKRKLPEQIILKSKNPTIGEMLESMNATENPRLYKSIKDLDDLFKMADTKKVEFPEIKTRKIKQIKSLVDSGREELAYKQSILLSRELMDKIFEMESRSVNKAAYPGRLPASKTP